MSTPDTTSLTDPTGPTIDTTTPSGNLYTFIGAQLRTRLVPPNDTEQVYQVSAQAIKSSVYFVQSFRPTTYANPDQVVYNLNSIADSLDKWSAVPGVSGITAVQVIDDQDQFADKLDVTVSSTSGRSSTVIEYGYPKRAPADPGTAAFTAAVNAARAQLDAVENA